MKRGRDRDGYSYEGGNLACGIRRVRKGGRIKFDGMWHQHDRLIPFVGDWVRVEAEDAFYNHRVPVTTYHWRFICYAVNERESSI